MIDILDDESYPIEERLEMVKILLKMKDDETNFKRLDRYDVNETNIVECKIMIKNEIYSDFHLPRPLNQYKSILDKVLL